jgi:hypothetical protein
MPAQLDMFAASIEERFRAFHRENPHVLDALVRLALEAKAAGRTRIGAKALWERLRWEFFLSTKGDEFALNNNFTARYVRLIGELHPDLAPLFERRALRAA